MRVPVFSARQLRQLQPREKRYAVTERAPRGEGRLVFRVHPHGLKEFYYRTRLNDRERLVRIGRFEQTPGDGGMRLEEVRARLATLVRIHRATGDVKGELIRRKELAAAEERARERAARLGDFGQLMDAYCQDLRDRGRTSARHVENAFKRAVREPFPQMCSLKAREVTPGAIQQILARLVRRGVERQVNLVRSYLSAAFQYGTKSDNDPTRLARDGAIFELVVNPVASVPRKAEFERVGERVLSEVELHRFWWALENVEPMVRSFLRLDLSLGGQRAVQLLRALWPSYDFQNQTVLLRDPKGRGSVTRDHLLPLTPMALEELEPLRAANESAAGPFVTRDDRLLNPSTVSKAVTAIWTQLVAEDAKCGRPKSIEKFVFRDIRRTCETQLASIGVNLETRAQLLSHGRSGVQAKHYDRHSYLAEKRRALLKWSRHLAKVIGAKPEPASKQTDEIAVSAVSPHPLEPAAAETALSRS